MENINSKDIQPDIEKYLNKATILLHSPETTEAIQQMLSKGDPVQQTAKAVSMIVQRIDAAAAEKGVTPPMNVKLIAMPVIVGMVAELAEAANIFTLDDDYKMLALATAMQDYFRGEMEAGRIDPRQLQGAIGQNIEQGGEEMIASQQGVTNKLKDIAMRYQGGLRGGQDGTP